MKIAILGTDHDVLRLTAAAASQGHEIVWLGDVRTSDERAMSRFAPRLSDRASEWELLLDRTIADTVLFGRGAGSAELRAEQLKRLAAEAVPLLAVHPVVESVLPYYEIDMIRREIGGIVRHYNPQASHPVVPELAGWMRDGHAAIGAVHQLTCERRISSPNREATWHYLARDMELVAGIAGPIRRVTAIGPRPADSSFASLQVQMICDGPASLRWSVGSPARAGESLRLALVGDRGSLNIAVPDETTTSDDWTWQIEIADGSQSDREPLPPFDAPAHAIGQLSAAVSGAAGEDVTERSTWDAATRAMEVVDAIELSLQKGRTIDVYQQQLTERLAFRGTMAAVGCALLLGGFVITMLVTLLAGAAGGAAKRFVLSWPIMLLAVLALFLLLQAAPLLAGKTKRPRGVVSTQMDRHR
jgi:hypothetical protein